MLNNEKSHNLQMCLCCWNKYTKCVHNEDNEVSSVFNLVVKWIIMIFNNLE